MDPASVAGSAVPVLVQTDGLPLTGLERAIVARFDGLRTLEDVARLMVVPLARVQALVAHLASHRAITLDELVEVDEIDLLASIDVEPAAAEPTNVESHHQEAVVSLHPDAFDEDAPASEPIPLEERRRRRGLTTEFPCSDEDVSLVSMILNALARLEREGPTGYSSSPCSEKPM